MSDASTALRFGNIEVRPATREVLVAGRPAALGARAFDLLLALAERRDRVVSKNELLDVVWPGLVVEENNLQVHISSLRKLLGPQAIATIAGRGYQFTLDSQPAADAPAASPIPGAPPRLLTSFVGREAELQALDRLLGSSRLLSLTAIGGSGKTRLAIEFGRRVAQRYADGLWFVDLAPVISPDRVALEVARAAGIAEEANRPVEETLFRQVGSKRALLIVDNCEHVLDTCAALVGRLLAESEYLQVVITSREPLGVAGEQIIAVRPLSLPAPDVGRDLALASEAVQLFVDRARLVLPQFQVDSANAACVVEICRRLDGIPLAIELAAARLRVLSVEQIRDKLDDRFRLLTAGNRAVSRHQTLQAVLQWSYEHLAPDEQRLLRRASVFAGGWTLEAALGVAHQGDNEIELLDRLGHLVDKSLISVERRTDGSTRFGMLETVRQYAQGKLHDSDEATTAHDSHLDYFLGFAARCRAQIPIQSDAALALIDSELANLLAAHAWCDQPHVAPERGLELVSLVRRYWTERGQFALGRRVFEEALRRPGADRPTAARAEALFSLGQHLFFAGAEAMAPLDEAIALSRAQGNRLLTMYCLGILAVSLVYLGRLQEGRECAEEGVAIAREIGTSGDLSNALSKLEAVCRIEGRFDEAVAALEESSRLVPPGDADNQHVAVRKRARLAVIQGQLDLARSLLPGCIRRDLKIGASSHAFQDLDVCWQLATAWAEWTRAARIQGAAAASADRTGVLRNAEDDPYLVQFRDKPREALGQAAFEAAWNAGYALELPTALDEVLTWLEQPGTTELAS